MLLSEFLALATLFYDFLRNKKEKEGNSYISEIYIPLFKKLRDWGEEAERFQKDLDSDEAHDLCNDLINILVNNKTILDKSIDLQAPKKFKEFYFPKRKKGIITKPGLETVIEGVSEDKVDSTDFYNGDMISQIEVVNIEIINMGLKLYRFLKKEIDHNGF